MTDHLGRTDRSVSDQELIDALPRRTAHAVHALLESSREANMPVTSAEACVYDSEALSARSTGRALAHAVRIGLAAFTGRYWIPTNLAMDQRRGFEARYLADTKTENDR